MAGENKAFPGLMEVLQGLKYQKKEQFTVQNRQSYKYFENISSNAMAPSWKDETKQNKNKKQQKKPNEKLSSVSVQR